MIITKEDIGNKEIYEYLLSKIKKKNPIKYLFKTKIEDSELNDITSISLSRMEINNLGFLKYLKNIKDVNFSNITLTSDLSILEELTTIEELFFNNTPIENFDVYLPNIKIFGYNFDEAYEFDNTNAYKNKLVDISILKCVPNVINISLCGNKIRNLLDIDILAPNIEEIVLEENPLETIEELNKLKNLKIVEITNGRKDELETLSNKPSIEYISVLNSDDMTRTYFETIENKKLIFY